jgi:hypothetical protein
MLERTHSPIERFGWPLVMVTAVVTLISLAWNLPRGDEELEARWVDPVAVAATCVALTSCAGAMLFLVSREARQLRVLRERLDWRNPSEDARPGRN